MRRPELTPEQRRVERELRANTHQQIVAMGVPDNAAAEIVDLAFHATEKATDALMAACEVGSDSRVQMNALLVACALVDVRLQQVRDTANAIVTSLGGTMTHGTVRMDGRPS